MNRGYKIALLARAYRMLARRPELWTHDCAERLRHALTDDGPGRMSALDAVLVFQAGKLDVLCAYAVAILRRPGERNAKILDLLGMLDPDRIAAIYYALPDERRNIVKRDPAWAYHLGRTPHDDVTAALADLEWCDPEPITEPSAAMLAAAARLQDRRARP
ncbi:MAG TPA: hypothetical protein VFJ77_03810 [Gaiellaceae bacterium]|nr:hypothetical protein [Gaiellaceae bacterium]